jgi:hypothetical protein
MIFAPGPTAFFSSASGPASAAVRCLNCSAVAAPSAKHMLTAASTAASPAPPPGRRRGPAPSRRRRGRRTRAAASPPRTATGTPPRAPAAAVRPLNPSCRSAASAMVRIAVSAASYSNRTTDAPEITYRPPEVNIRRSRGSGMPRPSRRARFGTATRTYLPSVPDSLGYKSHSSAGKRALRVRILMRWPEFRQLLRGRSVQPRHCHCGHTCRFSLCTCAGLVTASRAAVKQLRRAAAAVRCYSGLVRPGRRG